MSSLKDRIAAQRAHIATRNAGFARAYKFGVGDTQLLILPGVKDFDDFFKEYGAHYLKDPTTGSIVAVVGDAGITYGQHDPVREAIAELVSKANQRGDEDMAKKVKDWLAKPVTVLNAVVMGGVDTENKGKIVQPEFSSTGFGSILGQFENCINVGLLNDMSKGFLLTVNRVGTGQKDTRYTYTPYVGGQPKNPVPQNILDQRIDLDDYVAGKFGQSVVTALAHLSVLLGKDVTRTALGAAIASTAALSAPTATTASTSATNVATPSVDDQLMSLDELPIADAVFTETTTAATPAAAPPAQAGEFEDILAQLDAL